MMMTKAIALAIMAFSGHAIGREYIQHFDSSTSEREPVLTTITTDEGFPFPKTTGTGTASAVMIETEVCRPVMTSTCEVIQVTSTVTNDITSSVVVVTDVTTSSMTSGTTDVVQVTSTDIHTSASTTAAGTTADVTPTSVSGAGNQGSADAVGALAAVAALFLM